MVASMNFVFIRWPPEVGFGQQSFPGKQPFSMFGRLQLQWLEQVERNLLPECSQRLLSIHETYTVNIIWTRSVNTRNTDC